MNQEQLRELAAVAARPEAAVDERLRACDSLVRAGELDLAEPALSGLTHAEPAMVTARRLLAVCRQLRRWGIVSRLKPYTSPVGRSRPDFEAARGVLIARRPGATRVLLVFTGMAKMVWVSLHVLHQVLPAEGCHIVYLRDALELSYLGGIPELGEGYEATRAGFRELIASLGGRELYCLGSSGGGYGALRYALDLGARSVLGFAPATDPSPVLKALDDAGPHSGAAVPRHLLRDLREVYAAAAAPPRVRLVYGELNAADATASRRLEGLPTVTLHPVAGYEGHDVIAQTIATGEFRALVDGLLAGD